MADPIFETVSTWASNAQNSISSTFSSLGLQDLVRLIVVIGGYALLRPYLMQIGAKFQAEDHERAVDLDDLKGPASTKSLQSQVEVPEDSDEEADQVDSAKWGRGARRRQREMIRNVLEAEEKRREEEQANDEDEDIQEFLME
jgi:hypothetical protein